MNHAYLIRRTLFLSFLGLSGVGFATGHNSQAGSVPGATSSVHVSAVPRSRDLSAVPPSRDLFAAIDADTQPQRAEQPESGERAERLLNNADMMLASDRNPRGENPQRLPHNDVDFAEATLQSESQPKAAAVSLGEYGAEIDAGSKLTKGKVLRCWQEGRLILQRDLASGASPRATSLAVAARQTSSVTLQGKREAVDEQDSASELQLFDLNNALCLVQDE